MPIKDMVSPGLGFTPGSVQYIVTRGLTNGAPIVLTVNADNVLFARFRDKRDAMQFRDKRELVKFRDKREAA